MRNHTSARAQSVCFSKLVVELSSGTYEYANVSAEVWRRFSTSSSIGSFFKDTIEEDYQKRRIK